MGRIGAVVGGVAVRAGALGYGLAVDVAGDYCWRRLWSGVSVWRAGGDDRYTLWTELDAFYVVYLSDVRVKIPLGDPELLKAKNNAQKETPIVCADRQINDHSIIPVFAPNRVSVRMSANSELAMIVSVCDLSVTLGRQTASATCTQGAPSTSPMI